jgi:hypothetical protein
LANKKSRKPQPATIIENAKSKSWFFDIYEESEHVQDYRMNEWTMTQSAYGLDISDDESKAKEHLDKGKENVDPNEVSAPVTRSMASVASTLKVKTSRKNKDIMADDEPRTPLGDLNPTEFYAEGLDATSVVLVHDDAPEGEGEGAATETDHRDAQAEPEKGTVSSSLSAAGKVIDILDAPSINQILSTTSVFDFSAPTSQPGAVTDSAETDEGHEDIDIWESESSKDENEKPDFVIHADAQDQSSLEDVEVFALQEL